MKGLCHYFQQVRVDPIEEYFCEECLYIYVDPIGHVGPNRTLVRFHHILKKNVWPTQSEVEVTYHCFPMLEIGKIPLLFLF